MKIILMCGVLAASTLAFAQLPDAPSALQLPPAPVVTCGRLQWKCWDYGKDQLSNRETVQSRSWLIPTAGGLAATLFDAEMTHAGLAHHRCVESNIDPPYPSRGQLYRGMMPGWAGVSAFGFLLTKLKVPWLVYSGMQSGVAGIHLHGGISWMGNCW